MRIWVRFKTVWIFRMAKQMLTTDIRKNSLPSPEFADSLEAKMAKRPLQENGEFSRDEEAAHVEVEEKKPSQKEVVAKQWVTGRHPYDAYSLTHTVFNIEFPNIYFS